MLGRVLLGDDTRAALNGAPNLQLWYAPNGTGADDTGLRAYDTGLTALAWDWSVTPLLRIG
jgi:hypothetical protein